MKRLLKGLNWGDRTGDYVTSEDVHKIFTENMGSKTPSVQIMRSGTGLMPGRSAPSFKAEEIKMTRTLAEELVHQQGNRVTYAPE